MKRLQDTEKRNRYVAQYKLNDWFSLDLQADMELLTFERGEHLLHAGDPMPYLYFFVDGTAKVYTLMENGKSYSLRIYRPLEIIGDAEYSGVREAVCYVQAIEPVVCVAIPFSVIDQKASKDPVFLTRLIQSLSAKLNQNSQTSSINLLYPLENRLASYLLAIRQSPDLAVITDTYADLATLLGTSYRHLSRTLTKFEDDGYIQKDGHTIHLLRPAHIEELASDPFSNPG